MTRPLRSLRRTAPLVARAARFVVRRLAEDLPAWALYHNPRHTRQTVAACREIGRTVRLSDAQMEALLLAAWFHDTGYAGGAEGHERRSADIAVRWLASEGCRARTIETVRSSIMATHVSHVPRTLLHRVIRDADLVSLGRRTFLPQNELLRREVEKREGRAVDRLAWLHRSYRFLHGHRFATRYGGTVLEAGKQANLRRLQKLIRAREGLQSA